MKTKSQHETKIIKDSLIVAKSAIENAIYFESKQLPESQKVKDMNKLIISIEEIIIHDKILS